MPDRFAELESVAPLQGMLGYLNFASGRPDARFQKQLNDAYGFLSERGVRQPWLVLRELLGSKLSDLQASGASAFRDTVQARAVLSLAFDKVVPAYRSHHQDLLHHLPDFDFYQPFFL